MDDYDLMTNKMNLMMMMMMMEHQCLYVLILEVMPLVTIILTNTWTYFFDNDI